MHTITHIIIYDIIKHYEIIDLIRDKTKLNCVIVTGKARKNTNLLNYGLDYGFIYRVTQHHWL